MFYRIQYISTLILYFLCIGSVSAHPLDVSNTTMTLYDEYALGVTYVHPVELDRILVANAGVSPASIGVDSYYSLTGVLAKYLAETIEFENQGEKCMIGEFTFQENLMIDEMYSGGFPISYRFSCTDKILDPIVTIHFLIEVPLQTNKLSIYRMKDGEMQRTDYRVLNARKTSHSVSFSVGTTLVDSDNDGISDDDELMYRTDPNLADTDADGYADGYELDRSWDPLSSLLSPGQRPYEGEKNTTQSGAVRAIAFANNLTQDSSMWGSAYFGNILREIRKFAEAEIDKKNIIILLASIAFLGFLHALGPGHSKGILISQILDEHMSYMKSVSYCLIFTLVHLLDILVVVVLSKILFEYVDSSQYLSFISRISAVLVVGVGLYLLISSSKKYLLALTPVRLKNTVREKNFILMAIMTGLTPCAFGWTIFLMLIAIGKAYLAFPFLLALGVGIFLCLFLIATVTWYMKQRVYTISPRISRISPVISSFFILVIGCGLLVQNF